MGSVRRRAASLQNCIRLLPGNTKKTSPCTDICLKQLHEIDYLPCVSNSGLIVLLTLFETAHFCRWLLHRLFYLLLNSRWQISSKLQDGIRLEEQQPYVLVWHFEHSRWISRSHRLHY